MEEILAGDIYTLTDEETGEEAQYEIVAVAEVEGAQYVAIVPADEDVEEYAILRVEIEGEELSIKKYCDGDLELSGKIVCLRVVGGEQKRKTKEEKAEERERGV